MAFQRIFASGLIISFLVGDLANTVECYNVEPVPCSKAHLGEGPHWDIGTQNLYQVDLKNGKLKRFDGQKVYTCQIENQTFASFIIPIDGFPDRFAVGIEHHVASVKWDGVSKICKVDQIIATVEQSDSKYENNRFNDAKCDPHGRLYAGTMQKSDYAKLTGNLYRITKTNEPVKLISNLSISNGLTFDTNKSIFYFIDSNDFNVKAYDYDDKTGDIKNRRVIYQLNGTKVLPDGMTIDAKGFLYVAINGGSTVNKIDPENGQVLLKIEIPAKEVTSVAFGGPNLVDLFVTTADEKSKSGTTYTYRVTGLGVKGLPMHKFKL